MRRTILGALLLVSSGCAFTSLNITPPREPVGANLSGGKSRTVAVIVPFKDERPARDRCGMQKNGLNMDTASVYCSEDPSRWVADLLADELRSSGFDVVSEAQAGSGAVRIEGRLLQFFVEPKVGAFTFTPEADVHVRLVASSASGLLAERDFYVKGVEQSLVGLESNFQAASNTAARTIVKEMVAAIIALLDRYPGAQVRVSAVPAS